MGRSWLSALKIFFPSLTAKYRAVSTGDGELTGTDKSV